MTFTSKGVSARVFGGAVTDLLIESREVRPPPRDDVQEYPASLLDESRRERGVLERPGGQQEHRRPDVQALAEEN